MVLDEYEQIKGFCGFEDSHGTIVIADGIHAMNLARHYEPFAVFRKVGSAKVDASDSELSAPPSSPPVSTWPEDCPQCHSAWKLKTRTMGKTHGQRHHGICITGHHWYEP